MVTKRVRLSDKRIKALRPSERRYDVWDSEAPGLIVQVQTTGHLSYKLCRRMPGMRNPTRRLIGEVGTMELEEARAIAREWCAMIRRGADPASKTRAALAEQRKALTFEQVAEDYITRHVSKFRHKVSTEREIRLLIARWGRVPIHQFGRDRIIKFMDETGPKTPYMAHRQFGHLRALFNWLSR